MDGLSLAGIVVAAVLSRHFEKVVVVESEYLPTSAEADTKVRHRIRQYLQVSSF